MAKKKKLNQTTLIIGIVVAVLLIGLVWGLVGSSQAANIGVDCDFGVGKDGSVFCWKWHKNAVGQIGDALSNLGKK